MNPQSNPETFPVRRSSSGWYQWELLLLLSLAFFFHQADRAIFGVLLTPISETLGLSSEQMGLTGTVLFATLALMMPLAGYLGDRFSKKWIITSCVIFWSVATAMTGLATGLVGLIFFRSIATAGGESFYAPSAYPMLAAWHRSTRSTAMAVHQAALYIGVMTSGFLAGALALRFGWRATFVIFGAAGILLGFVLIFRLRPMPSESDSSDDTVHSDSSAHSDDKTAGGREAQPSGSFRQSVLTIIRIPTFWFITAGFTAIVFVNNAYLVWAPTFVQDRFDVSLVVAGGGAMFYHHVAAFAGILLGGRLTDRLVHRVSAGRLAIQTLAMFLGFPAILWLGATRSLPMAWTMMAVFGFFRGLYETNTHAALFDVIVPRYRATAVAAMTMVAFWFGSVSSLFLGYLRTTCGQEDGLAFGFRLLSLTWLVGAVLLLVAILFTFRKDRIRES